MGVFLAVLAFVVGLYGMLMVAMAWLAARMPSTPPPLNGPLPRVAVLVAARDEEDRLPRCIDALLAQDYPADLLDLYIADDHSTDGTASVIRQVQQRAEHVVVVLGDEDLDETPEHPRLHYVRVPDAAGHLRGKANAIHAAIEACDHDLLLVTDADCAPPPGWVRAHVAYLQDEAVGMVCGHTVVEHDTPLEALQALDWSYLLASASVLVEAGRPVTAMGNNMAFRRAAYEAVGGYPALPFSVTEDYVLFKTVADRSGFRVRFPLDPALHNATLPLTRLGDVYQQRRRWARGGMRAPLWVHGIYAIGHLAHLLPLVALVLAPWAGLAAIGVKAGADFALLYTSLRPSGRLGLLRAFPLFEAYLFVYMVTLPAVLAFFPRINWKDRKL
ncbi:MAG: glycosyltransferase [Rhodothermaceae bacterium]|nr:glycosyltransferase [Rhodothermaceae bacterium]